jgi:hypothetical protein
VAAYTGTAAHADSKRSASIATAIGPTPSTAPARRRPNGSASIAKSPGWARHRDRHPPSPIQSGRSPLRGRQRRTRVLRQRHRRRPLGVGPHFDAGQLGNIVTPPGARRRPSGVSAFHCDNIRLLQAVGSVTRRRRPNGGRPQLRYRVRHARVRPTPGPPPTKRGSVSITTRSPASGAGWLPAVRRRQPPLGGWARNLVAQAGSTTPGDPAKPPDPVSYLALS